MLWKQDIQNEHTFKTERKNATLEEQRLKVDGKKERGRRTRCSPIRLLHVKECRRHFFTGLESTLRGAPRTEGVFPFIGEFDCTLGEGLVGVHKVKMNWSLMVGWDSDQILAGQILGKTQPCPHCPLELRISTNNALKWSLQLFW